MAKQRKRGTGHTALRNVQKFFPKVTKVVDATRDVEVEVTPSDVSASKKREHAVCAMAVACKRKTHATGVIISRAVAYVIKGRRAERYLVPASVAREIVSFDRGAGFEPGEYKLTKPGRSLELGRVHGGHVRENEGQSSVTSLQKAARHFTANIRTSLGGPGYRRD